MNALMPAAELGLRVTAILGLTALLLLALRRASAATRHLVAVAGLVGSLALPLLAGTLPRLELAILPAQPLDGAADPELGQAASPQALEPTRAIPAAAPSREAAPTSTLALVLRGLALLAADWAKAAWAAVVLMLLARLLAGLHWLARLARGAADVEWSVEAARCAEALGLVRPVRLLRSPGVHVPVTAGVLDPVVILPEASTGWTAERRRLVLLHELAHVKRRDWLSLLVCEAAAAFWWFHPLSWLVLRAAHVEAEKATDALVVGAGARPSVYAGHLVEIVRALRGERPVAGAMPMARASDLEVRLRALLHGRVNGPASSRGRALAVALVGCAAFLAVVRPIAAAETAADVAPRSARAAETLPSEAKPEEVQPTLVASSEPWSAGSRQVRQERVTETTTTCSTAMEPTRAEAALEPPPPAAPVEPALLVAMKEPEHGKHEPWPSAGRLDALLANPPASPKPFYELGKQLLRDHDWDGAARAFLEAARRSTKPGSAYYNMACALAQKGATGEALDALGWAIESGYDDPGHVRTDPDLRSLHGESRFEALLADAEALELPPMRSVNDVPFWKKERYEAEYREAAARLESYLAAHPSSGRAAYGVGMARLGLGELDASARAFGRALELDYRRAATLYNLACVEARRERPDEAFRWLDRAIEAGYDDASHLRSDDDLDNLHGDARYKAAIRRAEERARAREEAERRDRS